MTASNRSNNAVGLDAVEIKRYCHSRCGIREYRHYGQYLPEKRPRLFSPTNVYVDALTERANLFAEFSCQSNC